MALLQVAGELDLTRPPLDIPAAALAAHEPYTADQLKALAAQPFRLSVTHADVTDRDTAAALYTLRSTANAADRRVLWLSATDPAAASARDAELADTITTVTHAHQQVDGHQWALPPGAIVVIDDPAAAEPDQLVDIARHVAAANARVILLDPRTARGPSESAVRLLSQSLPWHTTLTIAPTEPSDPLLEPVPAVTLADRLGRTHLSEPWRHVLTQYDGAARAARAAHRRHLALGWRTPGPEVDDPEHELGAGIDD